MKETVDIAQFRELQVKLTNKGILAWDDSISDKFDPLYPSGPITRSRQKEIHHQAQKVFGSLINS